MSRAAPQGSRQPHVCIIVQNLPVPMDRRVWLECRTLVEAGYRVSVVCPRGPGEPPSETLAGVRIHRYRPPPEGTSPLAFAREFAEAWLKTARLVWRVHRRSRIDVIQACNPPDTYFLLAALFKLRGTRFVFDHHDLCPELYRSRFDRADGLLLRCLLLLEAGTFRLADHVISTNESYREVALTRGRRRPEKVTVVRTGPDLERMQPREPDPGLRRGRRHLVCYLGVMGPQDGVDVALEAAAACRDELGRDDIHWLFMGSGDMFERLQELVHKLELEDAVEFTGRVPDEFVFTALSSADVGLSPDPPNPLNDVSTMNKTMEYMVFGLPVVAFDLRETRESARDAAVYVSGGDPSAYARAVVGLLDDPAERRRRGGFGARRAREELAWEHQAERYLAVYDTLLAGAR